MLPQQWVCCPEAGLQLWVQALLQLLHLQGRPWSESAGSRAVCCVPPWDLWVRWRCGLLIPLVVYCFGSLRWLCAPSQSWNIVQREAEFTVREEEGSGGRAETNSQYEARIWGFFKFPQEKTSRFILKKKVNFDSWSFTMSDFLQL